ncbi:PLP-dependent aminotransferase family protein [Pseudomonas syringae group genomosp. 3]|uniref:aminotransferase-like domain-containing protein n=1 Tax=Pseudomonas syringae group genomosp. 3 TaxID=251701 RepID=UPI002180170A|nr:PLP-dependent aminotransferase family protein [Pseudomonas syringae group genomosp. 3]
MLQGGQQGLDLVGKMLLDKGDAVVVEDPTFLGALIAFNPYEPAYATVPMDHDGMIMEALEKVLRSRKDVKFVYVVPDFQNPTGVTLSLARRRRIVELANEYDVYILEDSPYRELRYAGETLPPIKSFDTEGRVIYLGSFSKILAPGLRLGWAVASPKIIEKLGLLKLAADTQCSTLNMAAVSTYLEHHNIDLHIQRIRAEYKRRKELMMSVIQQTLPRSVEYTNPEGGMFTWLGFPEGFDSASFMLDRLLPEAKVAYVPGESFFAGEKKTNYARMSFSTQSDEDMVRGVSALGELLRMVL